MGLWKNLIYEMDRFWKWLLTVAVVFILAQFTGIYFFAQKKMIYVNDYMEMNRWTIEDYIKNIGDDFSSDYFSSNFYELTIFIPFFFLFGYTLWIWYKDWVGRQKTAYRIYMLLQSRVHVYFAKLIIIISSVLFFIGLQFILYPLEIMFLKTLMPIELLPNLETELILRTGFMGLITPLATSNFFIIYFVGFTIVLAMFWFVLVERSYRLRFAILFSLAYMIIICGIYIIFGLTSSKFGLLPFEEIIIFLFLIAINASLLLAHSLFMITKKIIV